jgi:carbonic anhydrase/acetyltransferase-like protein (isoleucine patch superfamily)
MEIMPKHVILPYEGVLPSFSTPVLHAGEGSAVVGRVTMGRGAWLGALSAVRADGHVVKVGDDFHLGPRSTLHIAHDVFPCLVGDCVTVGENGCVHACTVGNNVVLEDGCVVLDGAVVADNVAFEPGSIVFPGAKIQSGFLYAGMPAKPVRQLEPNEIEERRRGVTARADLHHRIAPRDRPAVGSEMHPSFFIAATATVKGRIVAAQESSVFFSNDLDAGNSTIIIGEKTNIQDNTIIQCSSDGIRIGRESTIGHNVLLNDCAIGDRSLIGIGSTVARGTVIGNDVLLAAGARTEEGQVLEDGYLYTGTPARKRIPLDVAKREMIAFTIRTYCHYSQVFKAAQGELIDRLASVRFKTTAIR